MGLGRLICIEVWVNVARISLEEKLERLLNRKLKAEWFMTITPKTFVLRQEGGTCADIFYNIANRKIKT